MIRIRGLIAGVVLALAIPGTAFAGQYTLHPRGFGDHTYSSWKGGEGEPDSTGDENQALYFQKETLTTDPVAAISVITGFQGTSGSELKGFSWDHRNDGHCGGGAPRWNITGHDSSGTSHTVFLGCAAALHTPVTEDPTNWTNDKYSGDEIAAQFVLQQVDQSDFTVDSIAIVFDEGIDSPPNAGSVYLDNITVQTDQAEHTWTSAADNGNG